MHRAGVGILLVATAVLRLAGGVAAQPPAVAGQSLHPAPGRAYPLPTDELMAPAPAVPPRTAYQRPPDLPPDGPGFGLTLPARPIVVPLGPGGRLFRFTPRYGRGNDITKTVLPDKSERFVVTNGIIFNITAGPNQPEVEFATDSAVLWVTGQPVDSLAVGFEIDADAGDGSTPAPDRPAGDGKRRVEVYLSGNVEVRTTSASQIGGQSLTQTVRANEVYYDVSRNRCVALDADLELSSPLLPDAVHLTGREIDRLDKENWEVHDGRVFSSKLPSDPGLRLDTPRASLRETKVRRRNIFGVEYRDFDGNPVMGYERLLTLRQAVTRVEGVPVFYLPYLRVDATDPLGPLVGIGVGQDRVFGTQLYTTFDVYKLLALRPPPGHRWRLHADYLSDRGPALGTDYGYTVPNRQAADFPTLPPSGRGAAKLYVVGDDGQDILGGDRGPLRPHDYARGRFSWFDQRELTDEFYLQSQVSYLSDQNFHEQFFKQEFDLGPNQETFAYLTWQREQLWAGGLVQQRLGQDWFTRTNWLPRASGAVVGQSFWDLFVYNARADAGYAQFRPAEGNPYPVMVTDQRSVDTGRFDLGQELSLPFALGPVKLAPYATLDLAYYTQDLTGDDRGRVYGGGGVRGSLPFSRLYEDAASELFNVRGLNHKVVVGANYYAAGSNTSYTRLPQLDRLNDDVTDYTFNYIRPRQTQYVSGPGGVALATSPIFDPQRYAIRRLVEDRIDTLDDIQVVQADVRQRLQTKRGYPGLEHTVDLVTLDLSGSFFPDPNRDNFGKSFAFLEYNFLWNVGDRVAVMSNGWFDPFDEGARYWTLGTGLDRPDGTSFYVGYRQTDPVNSKAVIGAVGYQLSRRYSTSVGVSYDFGIQRALSNSLTLTRTGSDLTVSLGFTYNAQVNNFGVQFLVVPNLVASAAPGRFAATALTGR